MKSKDDLTNNDGNITVTKVYKSHKKTEVASFVWTIISVVYTVIMVIYTIANKWVPSEFSVALIVLLVVWVLVLVAIVGISINNRDVKGGKKALKIYKKGIGIFKMLVTILFLIITIISLAGLAKTGIDGIKQIVVVVFSLIISIVQLALKVSIMVLQIVYKRKGKNMKVQAMTFVNGNRKDDKVRGKVLEKIYHTNDADDQIDTQPDAEK